MIVTTDELTESIKKTWGPPKAMTHNEVMRMVETILMSMKLQMRAHGVPNADIPLSIGMSAFITGLIAGQLGWTVADVQVEGDEHVSITSVEESVKIAREHQEQWVES